MSRAGWQAAALQDAVAAEALAGVLARGVCGWLTLSLLLSFFFVLLPSLLLQVPGSFELVYAAKALILSKKVDAVICIGCLIKGETMHFEYINEAVCQVREEGGGWGGGPERARAHTPCLLPAHTCSHCSPFPLLLRVHSAGHHEAQCRHWGASHLWSAGLPHRGAGPGARWPGPRGLPQPWHRVGSECSADGAAGLQVWRRQQQWLALCLRAAHWGEGGRERQREAERAGARTPLLRGQ